LRRGNTCRCNLPPTGRLGKCGILSELIDYFILISRANSTADIREVFPFIINEQFLRSCVDPPVPAYAYVYNEGKPTGNFIHSHTIIALEICEEPDERLTRLEALAIVAVTITRLEGDKLPKRCKTVPVMVISTFGRMKARILTAHYESEELIIRKTPLLDFAEDGPAEANMTLFMRCMASKAIDGTYISSNTPTVSFNPVQ
jgi:hypothetical protein